MNYFFTSDTHFDHKNLLNIIPELGRYFGNIDHYNETLIDAWNTWIENGDLVYHLGDFGFFKDVDRLEEIIKMLNGKIFLILGNHDRRKLWLHPKIRRLIAGIDTLKYIRKPFKALLCHYPIWDWKGMHHGTVHFHGHTHGRPGFDIPGSFYVGIHSGTFTPYRADTVYRYALGHNTEYHLPYVSKKYLKDTKVVIYWDLVVLNDLCLISVDRGPVQSSIEIKEIYVNDKKWEGSYEIVSFTDTTAISIQNISIKDNHIKIYL